MKLVVFFTPTKLPFLSQAGVKFTVLEETNDFAKVEMEVNEMIINDLFYAGELQGMARNPQM